MIDCLIEIGRCYGMEKTNMFPIITYRSYAVGLCNFPFKTTCLGFYFSNKTSSPIRIFLTLFRIIIHSITNHEATT
jgi:hypothetical protein